MIFQFVALALLILFQDGAHAFTRPESLLRTKRSEPRLRLPKEFIASISDVALCALRTDDQFLTREENDSSASKYLNVMPKVVNADGMPNLTEFPLPADVDTTADDDAITSYQKGLITIGFITFLFASNSPALHSVFSMTSNAPPVLFINAAVTVIGLLVVVLASPFLGQVVPDPSLQSENNNADARKEVDNEEKSMDSSLARIMGPSTVAGAELGLWKFFGTTANIYGLSQTSSDHGAFLIQLTTLIVPVAQGLMGVPIPTRIWTAIGLALGGVFMFTQDPNQSNCATLVGDCLCALAAIFYATYDLRLFKWGKIVPTDELITTKMVTQSLLSFVLLLIFGREETLAFLSAASLDDLELVGVVTLWSGLAVNALAPYLQVSGQQAVGPARAQILYASQPLWAAIMSFFLLGEQVGFEGLIGGSAFLIAMLLAATAEIPDPNCAATECEV